MPRVSLLLLGSLATMALAIGCEGGKPSVESSNTEAKVKGTVTINGKLANKGTVQFDPSNYQRKDVPAHTAEIGTDGTYSITTLTGENQVSVASPALQGRDTSNMTNFNAQAGENSFNIVLPPPAAAP